jgi:hypothetical protein
MTDFRTSREIAKGWVYEPRATVPCILPSDGLLAVFRLKDVEAVLNANYPKRGGAGNARWYFNDSYDREIADQDGDRVYANPQVLWQHFMQNKGVQS